MRSFADSVQLVSTPRRWLLAAFGATVALSIGCGDGPTDPAPAVPASITAASATALSGVVGQQVAPLPSVVVRNQHGQPMFGVRVTFTVTGGAGSITGATPFTNANGVATVGSWTLGPTAGDNTLAASVGSLPAVTFVATAQAGAAATLAKSAGDEQTGPVGAALPIAPAVIVQDVLGNPVADVTVIFEVASGGGSVTGATAVTNSLGIAAVGSWTLGTSPGQNTLTATMGELTVTFTATAVAGPPAAIAKVAGDNQTTVVAQAVPVPPSVRITDVHGNPAPGVTVTFAVATGGGSVTGGSQVTDADGVATVGSWTLGSSTGTNTLTATVGSLTTTFTATATAPPNVAPAVSITSPADGSSFAEGEEIIFQGTATDPEDGDLSAEIEWSSDLDGSLGTGVSLSTGGLSVGTHTITASVTDAGGLSGSASIEVTVVANVAPGVSIITPANGSSFVEGEEIILQGTATDSEDGDLSAEIVWSSDRDGSLGTGASLSTTALSVGTHTITASVTDAGGLPGSASIEVTVVANVAPGVSIITPADGSSFAEGEEITFEGTATDPEDGDLSAEIEWSSDLDGSLGTGASLSTTELTVGTHTITASVTDSGGLTGSASIEITVN